jgi:tetratricopeptide (TPR) repeat protein
MKRLLSPGNSGYELSRRRVIYSRMRVNLSPTGYRMMNRELGRQLYFIVAASLIVLLPIGISGQGVTEQGTLPGSEADSLYCQDKMDAYRTALLGGDLAGALEPWRKVLAGCPSLSEEIYADGESIYRELFDQTGMQEYVDSIMMILTQRTYYFGNKPAYDLHKADILLDLAGDDPAYLGLCYNILAEAAGSFPDQMECAHFVRLATVAASLYAMGVIDAGELGSAFVTAIGTVDWRMENHISGCGDAEDLQNMETFYRTSGAMTCEGLETLYGEKLDRNFRDTAFVSKIFAMTEEAGCTGSDLYYNVAVKMFASDRSASNAVRLAELNAAAGNNDKAISYFTEAYNRDTSSVVRSGVLMRVAMMELRQGKRQEARDRAEHAWQLDKKNAEALMLLAECYAGADLGNKFDNLAAYWVAADYLDAAVKADPSLRKEAEARIKVYMRNYPTREDCFYRKILDEGVVYTVGGWVSEVTRVRFRKE